MPIPFPPLATERAELPPIADDPAFVVDAAKAKAGETIYGQRCAACHGAGVQSGGLAPELIRSAVPLDAASFTAVLHDGLLTTRGMPSFEELSAEEIAALQHYIRSRARHVQAAEAGKVQLKKVRDDGQ